LTLTLRYLIGRRTPSRAGDIKSATSLLTS